MKIKKKKCEPFFRSFLYKKYFWLMLLNFKILAFFWRQFYQEKGREWAGRNSSKTTMPIGSGNSFDWSSSATSQRSQADWVRNSFDWSSSTTSQRSQADWARNSLDWSSSTTSHRSQADWVRNSFDWSSSTTSQRSQANQVWKSVWLIYYKSEGWSCPEIGTDIHLPQVKGLRPTARRDC